MSDFLKAAVAAVITVVFCLIISRQNKEMAVLLSLLVCAMIAALAVSYLSPVITFFEELKELADLDSDFLEILLKSVGIGLLAEIAALICSDSGNAALAKTIHILSVGVILYLAIPLFSGLMELLSNILGGA